MGPSRCWANARASAAANLTYADRGIRRFIRCIRYQPGSIHSSRAVTSSLILRHLLATTAPVSREYLLARHLCYPTYLPPLPGPSSHLLFTPHFRVHPARTWAPTAMPLHKASPSRSSFSKDRHSPHGGFHPFGGKLSRHFGESVCRSPRPSLIPAQVAC